MNTRVKWAIVRVLFTTAYLMAGWILFTGSVHWESIRVGAFFAFPVALLTYDSFIMESEAGWRSLVPRVHWGVAFLLVLLLEIFRSSFVLSWMIITGRHRPRVVYFRTRLRTDIARAAVATSITVTPGTVTLEMDDDHLIVHWMNASTTHSRRAGDLIKGRMEWYLARLWG